MSSFTSASLISSAWASVLTAMNSTPFSPASIMRLTALHATAADADDLDDREVVLRIAGHRCCYLRSRGRAAAGGRPEHGTDGASAWRRRRPCDDAPAGRLDLDVRSRVMSTSTGCGDTMHLCPSGSRLGRPGTRTSIVAAVAGSARWTSASRAPSLASRSLAPHEVDDRPGGRAGPPSRRRRRRSPATVGRSGAGSRRRPRRASTADRGPSRAPGAAPGSPPRRTSAGVGRRGAGRAPVRWRRRRDPPAAPPTTATGRRSVTRDPDGARPAPRDTDAARTHGSASTRRVAVARVDVDHAVAVLRRRPPRSTSVGRHAPGRPSTSIRSTSSSGACG